MPKQNGYLNVGVGGMADKLKRGGDDIRRHWGLLCERLVSEGLLPEAPPEPGGYSYFLRHGDGGARRGNAFVVGDAAGLATRDMCEGIGPAVQSGLRAARAVTGDEDYRLDGIERFTAGNFLVRKGLEWAFLH